MKMTKNDWEQAAYHGLIKGGSRAVAVANLAEQLGVTRGSFYHYFDSREQLLKAALGIWEATATAAFIDEANLESDGEARLKRLFSLVFRERTALAIADRQLAAESVDEPVVREAVARVTRRREAYLTECYSDLGFGEIEARDRALLAYMMFQGWLHLEETSGETLTGRTRRLGTMVEELLLPPTGASQSISTVSRRSRSMKESP